MRLNSGPGAHAHETESYDQFNARYTTFFSSCNDLFELQRGLNNCFAYDLVPSPTVVESALQAARRINNYGSAVRIMDAVKVKVENQNQYKQYLQELNGTLTELGECSFRCEVCEVEEDGVARTGEMSERSQQRDWVAIRPGGAGGDRGSGLWGVPFRDHADYLRSPTDFRHHHQGGALRSIISQKGSAANVYRENEQFIHPSTREGPAALCTFRASAMLCVVSSCDKPL